MFEGWEWIGTTERVQYCRCLMLQVFSCPGASEFLLDFDPRCVTEKRYDYLEFTDSRGITVK